MKIIFHQWKSRVRSERITVKSAIIVVKSIWFSIENYRINISKQNHQTKRLRNWEGKRFYQLEISLTQLTFFRGTRGNLYPKKKRDPILLLSRFFLLLIVGETMNIRGEDEGKFQASNRLPLSIIFLAREELDSKSFFSKETKEISRRKSAADFRCVWERQPISEKEWESEKNNNETNA